MKVQKRPKSRALKEHLLDQMRKQRIAVGGRLPSETTLMQEFSLSRSTVRQVLLELSAQGLIERQQGRGTFRVGPLSDPDPISGIGTLDPRTGRREQRSLLIGVWFNWPAGPLFGLIAEGIHAELREWGYHAVFEAGGLEAGAEHRGIERLMRKGLDGFIVSPSTHPDDTHGPLIQLIRRNVPLVLVDRPIPGHETHVVATHGELGAEEVVSHLIGLGHRRIGFIGISGLSTLDDRLRGYRQMMQEHRLPIDDAWVRFERDIAVDCGRRAAAEILSLPPGRRPTAMFGATDVIAETIAIAARDLHLDVPGEVSIAGFDDVNIDPASPAWLTTYAQPKRLIGQQAARLLMKQLRQPTRGNVIVLLEGELVERASTAPPMSPDAGG